MSIICTDVYRAVKKRFRALCDDTVLCKQTCHKSTNKGPEWQHRVRSALHQLKSLSGPVVKSQRYGYWTFNRREVVYPDELRGGTKFREGAVLQVLVNAYERDPDARLACIENYGTSCCICGFNFGQAYGPKVEGFIHVHHLVPLSEARGEYTVDPIADLRPVCPNCHAVLHYNTRAYSIEEVRALLRA